jgi:hypothetical protein
MTNKEYADNLRLLADFFEQHTEVKIPYNAGEFNYYSAQSKTEMATLARALGKCDKVVTDTFFELHAQIGEIKFRASTWREKICTRRQVGSISVPASPEVLIPAREAGETPVYEWHCPDSLFD